MRTKGDCELFSSGLKGTEAAFGEIAEKYGVKETVYTFDGHNIAREQAENVIVLSTDDLGRGDISMEIVSTMMNRTYYESKKSEKYCRPSFMWLIMAIRFL